MVGITGAIPANMAAIPPGVHGVLLLGTYVSFWSAGIIFTARCYASAVLAMGLCLSVCVCLSTTSRCSTKTAKHRITQTTPHDSPGSLVF